MASAQRREIDSPAKIYPGARIKKLITSVNGHNKLRNSGNLLATPSAIIAVTRLFSTGALRMNSKETMHGSAMPTKQHNIHTNAWSRTMCRNQPRQRDMLDSVSGNTLPTCDNVIVCPPTALGMAPTSFPPQTPPKETKVSLIV